MQLWKQGDNLQFGNDRFSVLVCVKKCPAQTGGLVFNLLFTSCSNLPNKWIRSSLASLVTMLPPCLKHKLSVVCMQDRCRCATHDGHSLDKDLVSRLEKLSGLVQGQEEEEVGSYDYERLILSKWEIWILRKKKLNFCNTSVVAHMASKWHSKNKRKKKTKK